MNFRALLNARRSSNARLIMLGAILSSHLVSVLSRAHLVLHTRVWEFDIVAWDL